MILRSENKIICFSLQSMQREISLTEVLLIESERERERERERESERGLFLVTKLKQIRNKESTFE